MYNDNFRLSLQITVVIVATALLLIPAMSGGVAADDGNFEINITDAPESIAEGEDIKIVFNITNTGNETAERDIVFEGNENEVNRTKVSVSASGSETQNLTWKNTPTRPARELQSAILVEGGDADGVDSTTTIVRWNETEVQDLTVNRTSVSTGARLNFTATIRNIGTTEVNRSIRLKNNTGRVINNTTKKIGPTESVQYTNQTTAPIIPGEYVYTLEPERPDTSNAKSVTVTVDAFNVKITETIVDGSQITVEANITKDGSRTATQDVFFDVEGVKKDTKSVTVEGTTPTPVKFTYDTGNEDFTDRNISVRTQQPDIDTARISKAAIKAGPKINSVTNQFVQAEETVTINYTADGPDVDTATLVITDPNGEIFRNRKVSTGTELEESIEMPVRDRLVDGRYDIRLTVEDDFGRTKSATLEGGFVVADIRRTDETNEFSQSSYRSPAGDFVEIDLTHESFDEAYVLIGGDKQDGVANPKNYLDILKVSNNARFVINTRLIGTNRPSEEVYIPLEGDVTSYAHSIGPDSEPKGEFRYVSFEGKGGNKIADSLAEYRSKIGLTPRHAPLQADRYRLVAGGTGTIMLRDQNIPDLRNPFDRSNIVLTQPELGQVNTYVLPTGAANEIDQYAENEDVSGIQDIGELKAAATESDYIARGDRLLVEVQATGMFGAALDGATTQPTHSVLDESISDPENSDIPPEQMAALRNRPEGVEIDLSTKRLGSPNRAEAHLRFDGASNSDVYVLPDNTADLWENESRVGDGPIIGGFYMIVDTRGTEPFDRQPGDGDVLEFEIAYESPPDSRFVYENPSLSEHPNPFNPADEAVDGVEHYPYFGDRGTTIERNATIRVQEPSVTYDRTTPNGELIVPAESDGQIFGATSIAPGSRVTIQLIENERPNQELITIEDVKINEDRTFSATGDFSELSPGQQVDVELYINERIATSPSSFSPHRIDKRTARVVGDLDNPATYEIESIAEQVETQQRSSLQEIEATINNTGSISGRQIVEIRIDNETIREESLVIQSGQSTTVDLSGQFVTLPIGTYNYTVLTEDDQRTGQLTVTEPDSGTVISSSENVTTSSSPVDDTSGTGNNNESGNESGLFGLLGIRSRDVVVATAVTGAVHVLGYWA
ncbi:hypothetical protein EGH24_01270 [Halonotius terrestris]|uniref:CARDB protein n=1 Tax=Halonotius terrestris TaxID=2487750 RepID=A0A8J8TDR9_9EURY|nr:BGTF surface domain-containing protein [Halonotius terrestris]TQQ83454.1 hypothetical protein EGH24_01270 [Halonotius terrestris]